MLLLSTESKNANLFFAAAVTQSVNGCLTAKWLSFLIFRRVDNRGGHFDKMDNWIYLAHSIYYLAHSIYYLAHSKSFVLTPAANKVLNKAHSF